MESQSHSDQTGPTRWALPGRGDGAGTPRRRLSRPVVAVGLTALLASAGAGAAFAVSGGGSASAPQAASVAASGGSSTTTPSSVPAGHHHHRGMMGGGMFGGGMGAVIHGSGTVRTATGYKTVDVQTGTVDSVTATALTVISSDNFKQTYTIAPSTVVDAQAGGISTVQKGDTVRVVAEPSGSTVTATDVMDQTRIGDSRRGFGFGPAAGAPGQGGPLAPSAPSAPTAPTAPAA